MDKTAAKDPARPASLPAAAGRGSLLSVLWSFEILFVLFLFAGRFKADPRFAAVPVDITLLLLLASLVAGLVVLLRAGMMVGRHAWLQWLLALALFAWVLGSWLWSPGGGYATQKATLAFVVNLWAMAAAGLIVAGDPARLDRLLLALVLFAAWVAVETLLLLRDGGAVAFVAAFGGDYLGIGSVLSFAVIVLVMFVVGRRRPWWLIAACMASSIGLIALMFPVGGRGPIAATLAALLAGVVLAPLRGRRSFPISGRGKLVVAFGVVATIAVVLRILESGDYALAAERFLVLAESGMGESAGVRWYYYVSSLGIIADHPWIGVGAGGWPVAMGMGSIRDYPHNLFLEVLAEQGLVGGALLCALLGYSGWLVFRRDGALSTQAGFTATLLAVSAFVSAMVSGDISDNRVLFCMLGLCAAASRRSTAQ